MVTTFGANVIVALEIRFVEDSLTLRALDPKAIRDALTAIIASCTTDGRYYSVQPAHELWISLKTVWAS